MCTEGGSELSKSRNLTSAKRGNAHLILFGRVTTNCESIAYRSLMSEKGSARGVRKVTTGITGLWQPSVRATLLFDPSMSALPIIEMQKSQSVGLFTHQ